MNSIQDTIVKGISLKGHELLKDKKKLCVLLEDLSPELQEEIAFIEKLYSNSVGTIFFNATQAENSEKEQFMLEADRYLDNENGIRDDVRRRFLLYFEPAIMQEQQIAYNTVHLKETNTAAQDPVVLKQFGAKNIVEKFLPDEDAPVIEKFLPDEGEEVLAIENFVKKEPQTDVNDKAPMDITPKMQAIGIVKNKKVMTTIAGIFILLTLSGIFVIPNLLNPNMEKTSEAVIETFTDENSNNGQNTVQLPLDLYDIDSDKIQEYKTQADSGDALSQYVIGNLYLYGIRYEKNYEKAFHYFKSAADQDYTKAYSSLGLMYLNHWHVEKNIATANEWFKKAADKNDVEGLHYLAMAYYNGIGVEKDYKKAVSYFTQAAEKRNMLSEYFLAHCYRLGIGVEKNDEIAQKKFKASANSGIQESYAELLNYYIDTQKYEQAYHWAKKAAESKILSVKAQGKYQLSAFYEEGKVVPQDLRTSKKLMLEAQEIAGKDYSQEILRIEDKLKDYE